jgi:photosystem II protein PsbQ
MKSYRSILALLLAIVTTFLVSCGSPKAATPTYTPEKLAKIEQLSSSVSALRDKMPFLAEKIQNKNWTDVGTYIHGPLGELRQNISYLTRELLPADQKAANAAAKELFNSLQNIDAAATKAKSDVAVESYREALKDFDAFFSSVPKPKNTGVSGS